MSRCLVLLPAILALASCSRAPEPASAPVAPATPAAPVAAAPAPPPITGPIPYEYVEPVVGGARMSQGKDILANLSRSRVHTILVAAITQSGLDKVLSGPGPFTLFAPTDDAFKRMNPDYRTLLEPANHDKLVKLLGYHVVAEKLDADTFAGKVMAGNGNAVLTTTEGGTLKATVSNGKALLIDGKGAAVAITLPNVLQSNGVVLVVDSVLSPP